MALPELIEIVPLDKPVRAEITVPGSKSITNRALILAALADGPVTLKGALWSEDTQIMVACLKELGFVVHVSPDPEEPCNRTLLVVGQGGIVPAGGTEAEPVELFVGNAGTAARFLAPFLCLGGGVYRLHGVPRMHERPQAALFQALRELGCRVESENENDKLPVRIFAGEAGRPPESMTEFTQRKQASTGPKKCRVSITESSQFASALLLSSKAGRWEVEIEGENAEESPYVAMTSKLMEVFPTKGGTFQIEPDASSGSYFLAAGTSEPIGTLETKREGNPDGGFTITSFAKYKLSATVRGWRSHSGWQVDAKFPEYFLVATPIDFSTPEEMAALENKAFELWGPNWRQKTWDQYSKRQGGQVMKVSRQTDLGDSIMTLITVAPLSGQKIVFTDLGRLRVQECERVVALRTELTKCGAKVIEEGDTLTVYPAKPGELHGAEIETYNDHRMAMCFAILGLKIRGICIKNPACVKKTFPNFFQKLADAPPHGLGAEIWEVKNGRRTRRLTGADLFAD
jgi:3-phosphoshikimate 1-carboxyvinyltransferase